MRPIACAGTVFVLTALCAGCVERRFVITSDPPGATVYHNGEPAGPAPADISFVYYGVHEFTLVRAGYETLVVRQRIRTPWYEYPGIDFISENLWPFMISDVRRFHFTMQQATPPRSDQVLERALDYRNRAAQIGPPRQNPVPIPTLPPPSANPDAPVTPPVLVPPGVIPPSGTLPNIPPAPPPGGAARPVIPPGTP